MSATPESQAKMATKPADAPLRPGLIACVLDAPLVSVRAAGIPRAAALTIPESRPVRVNLLESGTSQLIIQSHPTPPLTCQSHLKPPLTCQSHLTPQQFTQCHFTSLLSHCPTWTWPSVPSPGSTSAPPPSWIVPCVKRLEAALWGGGGLCHKSGCLSPHYSCTSPMDYNSHNSLHYDTHIPIHHCTNHTTVTNHSFTLIVSPHLHLIHTHTYKQHTSLHSPQSLVLPQLTF